MAITALSGPIVSFGQAQQTSTSNGVTGQVQDYNGQRGPSLFDLSFGLLDPRAAYCYEPGADVTTDVYGFYRAQGLVDFAPSSASSNAFCVSSATQPVANTAITLTPSSAKGTYRTTIVAPEDGQTYCVIAIDSTAATLQFGQDGTVAIWNPAAGTGRCISFSGSSYDGGTWSIAGRDMYGYKITESVAASSSGATTTSKKAFKYISSIVAATTIASTGVNIGLSDTYGMPFYVSEWGPNNLTIAWSTGSGSGSILGITATPSSATLTFGSTVATQTSTTPDVFGTWLSTGNFVSNGTNVLQIAVVPTANQLANISNTSVSALFGAVQYSSV